MNITDETVEEFARLWQGAFDERLDQQRAREYAEQLIRMACAIYGSR